MFRSLFKFNFFLIIIHKKTIALLSAIVRKYKSFIQYMIAYFTLLSFTCFPKLDSI